MKYVLPVMYCLCVSVCLFMDKKILPTHTHSVENSEEKYKAVAYHRKALEE